MSLVEALVDPARQQAVVADCERLVESEVANKRGVRGLAVKAGFKTVRRVRPGFIRQVIRVLLPEFAAAVDPFHAAALERGADVEADFRSRASDIADALLAVTDRRAARADNRVVLKAYRTLRGQAKGHVASAVPGLARIVVRHT